LPKRIRTHSEDKALVEQRRRHIVMSSLGAFIKNGYARTSVEDILKACDMGRGTMYHYVGSKDDIVYLIVQYGAFRTQSLVEDFAREAEKMSPREALREAMERYYRRCDEVQDCIMFGMREAIYLSERDRRELLDNLTAEIDFFERLLERGIEAGEFQVSHPRLFAYDILARAHAWATGRWFLRKQATLEEYMRHHIEWVFKVISAENGLPKSGGDLEQNCDAVGALPAAVRIRKDGRPLAQEDKTCV